MKLISASEAKQIATAPKQSAWLELAAERIAIYAHKGSLSCLVPVTDFGPDAKDIATLQGLGYAVMKAGPYHAYGISWEYAYKL